MRYLAKVTALRCLVAGHAHCTSMASRTAYSTWTPQKPTFFDGHYLRNRPTLDISVLGYIGIVQHKEHSPEVLSIPPGTPVHTYIYSVFHNECPNFKSLYFCNHEPQMNETCTT